jgi:transposase
MRYELTDHEWSAIKPIVASEKEANCNHAAIMF